MTRHNPSLMKCQPNSGVRCAGLQRECAVCCAAYMIFIIFRHDTQPRKTFKTYPKKNSKFQSIFSPLFFIKENRKKIRKVVFFVTTTYILFVKILRLNFAGFYIQIDVNIWCQYRLDTCWGHFYMLILLGPLFNFFEIVTTSRNIKIIVHLLLLKVPWCWDSGG